MSRSACFGFSASAFFQRIEVSSDLRKKIHVTTNLETHPPKGKTQTNQLIQHKCTIVMNILSRVCIIQFNMGVL